ncbi:50S ribosomal protein L24 [Spirochaetia bacterium]|nr:50S ribosomal protein L24 [Spirochaetia bacterium]
MAVQAQHKYKLKKDDTVQIIAGKDKGKRGRILKLIRDKDRVVVEGANIVKKAKKRRNQQDRGGIVEIEAGIHSSNLMIVCKKCGPTRIGYKLETGATNSGGADSKVTKTRVCKKCGEAL